jgi:DNA-binding response OmpR family regulator
VAHRQVVAVEGVARSIRRGETQSPEGEPTQQRLASLMYEVHDLLHRIQPPSPPAARVRPQLAAGDVVLDLERLSVTLRGEPVSLTAREVLVLRYLLDRPGRIITRAQLLTDVWGYQYTGDHRTVDVHISRLRRKLPPLRDVIVAVKHVGYRVEALPEVKARAI